MRMRTRPLHARVTRVAPILPSCRRRIVRFMALSSGTTISPSGRNHPAATMKRQGRVPTTRIIGPRPPAAAGAGCECCCTDKRLEAGLPTSSTSSMGRRVDGEREGLFRVGPTAESDDGGCAVEPADSSQCTARCSVRVVSGFRTVNTRDVSVQRQPRGVRTSSRQHDAADGTGRQRDTIDGQAHSMPAIHRQHSAH